MNPPIRKSANSPITATAVSPGRLDVMGGIADYSGSLLLQMPISETTRVSLTRRSSTIFTAITDTDKRNCFEIDVNEIKGLGYAESGRIIRAKPGGDWAVYILGCYIILANEKGLVFGGDEIKVTSDIPTGKGVSSSAAIEVATMHAIRKAYDLPLEPLELAVLSQKVENLVVGAACGLMDQLSVNLGKKNHLLPIICQPHHVMKPIMIPAGLKFFGIDSGVRHAVSGASYSDVRAAAFMAMTIIMKKTGADITVIDKARNSGQWNELPFKGFLGNISLEQFDREFAATIPEKMTGQDFINEYDVSIDRVTAIDPGKTYALRFAADHPVRENNRIKKFMTLINQLGASAANRDILQEMGELMFGSHEGYSSVGLGEPATQEIVNIVRAEGTSKGVYGARISGGGSGGTVVIMADEEKGVETVKRIHHYMQEKTGRELYLFSGSSDGAHYVNALL